MGIATLLYVFTDPFQLYCSPMRPYKYILLLLVLTIGSCSEVDEPSGFSSNRVTSYNQQVKAGRQQQQSWTSTPYLIMQHLLRAENTDLEPPSITMEQVRHPDASVTITVTQEHLQDDSVNGERQIVTFVHEQQGWVVKQVRMQYKCQTGHGHSDYAATWCS
jgi:hypothetical protein